MEHFKEEQWVDFANDTISADAKQDMEAHLAKGCALCNQAVSLWRKVRHAGNAERNYQPPLEAVRIAKAAFAASHLASGRREACTWAEVVFDSFLQPVVAGARSGASGARQMLYRADPYQIDVQVEMGPDQRTLVITGQVLDLRQPGFSGSNVLVVISNLHGHVVRTTTDQFGEFRNEIPDSGNLELAFPGLTEKPVIIALGDPLGRLEPETRPGSVRKSKGGRKARKKT